MISAPSRKETTNGNTSEKLGINSVLRAAVTRAGSLILYGIARMRATMLLINLLIGLT